MDDKLRYLSQEEKDMLVIGLDMRRNYIETSNPHCSAANASRYRSEGSTSNKVNALSVEQMKLIVEMEELKETILQDRVILIRKEEA